MHKNNFPQIKTTKNTKTFGVLPNGQEVTLYTLRNNNDCELSVMNYGATITALKVATASNKKVDVVLGFDSLEGYINSFNLPSSPYFGTTVGRFAGRIKEGKFTLNGKQISLATNNGEHHLHGGEIGFSTVFWSVKSVKFVDNPSITLAYTSKNNDDFFPGDLHVEVTYTLTENNEVKVAYSATASEDTIVNLTQHSYFNLQGHASAVNDQRLHVNAQKILETSADLIPTGNYVSLENHPFDFTESQNCPTQIDTTFVLENRNAAVLSCEKTNLKMTVTTNQPGVHIYVGGNCFDQIKGKEGVPYHPTSGICFETQNFPDSPNHSHFPNAILRKGETYRNNTVFKFENLAHGILTNQALELMELSHKVRSKSKIEQ